MASGKAQNTRERLLESATAVFAERGLEHASIAEIARLVGITSQGVYRYFPNKRDLFLAAFEWDTAGLIDEVLAEVDALPMPALTGAIWQSVARNFDKHPLSRRVFTERQQDLLDASLHFESSIRYGDYIVRECKFAQGEGFVRSDIDVKATLDSLCYIRAHLLFPLAAQGKLNSPEWIKASHVVAAALFAPVPQFDNPDDIATFTETMAVLGERRLAGASA